MIHYIYTHNCQDYTYYQKKEQVGITQILIQQGPNASKYQHWSKKKNKLADQYLYQTHKLQIQKSFLLNFPLILHKYLLLKQSSTLTNSLFCRII